MQENEIVGAIPRTVLHAVETKNSLVGTQTRTQFPEKPSPNAPVEARKEYVEAQLDSIIGSEVHGRLKLLGGHKNRLQGGVSPVLPASSFCIDVVF